MERNITYGEIIGIIDTKKVTANVTRLLSKLSKFQRRYVNKSDETIYEHNFKLGVEEE